MEAWKVALGGAGAFAIATGIGWTHVNSEAHDANAELVGLEADVSVIMPTLNEEKLVGHALQSLKNQNIVGAHPEKFEFVVVDSYSEDATVDIARPYVDMVLHSPRGILNARILAVNRSRGDIIVSTNADCVYPPNFINTILKPFADPDVVAVTGLRVHEGIAPLTMWYHLLFPRMFGSNSAFCRWAFDAVGGFNMDVDQSVSKELVWAEEVDFPKRLSGVGKYIFEPKAIASTSPRRLYNELDPKRTSFV